MEVEREPTASIGQTNPDAFPVWEQGGCMRLSSPYTRVVCVECVCTRVFKWVQVCIPRAAEISHLSWWEWSRPCFSASFPFMEAVGFPQG